VKRMDLDASKWRTRDDFYDALLPLLGAPGWHGRNLDALHDSITSNDINLVNPPFAITLSNLGHAHPELREYMEKFVRLILDLHDAGYKITLDF
jgi:RNAse (barnase) inhibitor barstar